MFRLLCIDDNKNNLFTLESILNQLKDIKINTALSAQEGLSVLLHQNIDMILLDIQMPGMDGFEAAELIKSNKKTAHIPIIFLTAIFQSDEFEKKGFKTGAVEYLTKPIDDNKLLNKIGLYQKLIESEKKLHEQKAYMQKIIDMQEQILIIINQKKLFSANQRFLDFFEFKDLSQFKKSHQCICEFFIEKDGFLPPTLNKGKKIWLNRIINSPEKMHLAIVRRHNSDVILSVNAILLDIQTDLYVVTLTDVTQMHRVKEQFKYEALTDKLTGVFNRTKFDAVFDNAVDHVTEQSFTLAILDIDHFKQINDEFGHLQGDIVLKELVKLIENNIRSEDIIARWGGEEFALIFFTSVKNIKVQLEKIRQLIEKHIFSDINKSITVSIGVGEYKSGIDKKLFFKQVDDVLYQAKHSGRNCIVYAASAKDA